MGYGLGVDLGTTYTAAAVFRDGRAEICTLGSRGAAVPSVVLLRDDETVLTGEAANRRALTEPERVAREFKRRLGDTTPILVGGSPYSAEALMARLLRSVVDEVRTREGGDPDAIAISHPANWGLYKIDLLRQAVRIADLGTTALLTEPEAAAIHYASQQRVEPGSVVAVYDLGGGTFDAAVLRKTDTGFEILGEPEGIERLGGIDFDAAVFAHVSRALGGKLQELDEDDPATIAAVARLRDECNEAKEALSSDTDAAIPVLLPNISTEVRITRTEFEAMIRPSLVDSIEAMRRALRSAGVTAEEVSKVLLVGGSSRMPLVGQLVGAELGRPVAVDAHPKHAVALGAAIAAVQGGGRAVGGGAVGGAAAGAAAVGAAVQAQPPAPTPPAPTAPQPVPAPQTADAAASSLAAPPPTAPPPTAPPTTEVPLGAAPRGGANGKRSKRTLIGVGAAVVAVLAVIGAVVALGGGGDDETAGAGTGTTEITDTTGDTAAVPQTSSTNTTSSTTVATTTTLPPDEECSDAVQAEAPWVCLRPGTVTFDGRLLVGEFDADWDGQTPDIGAGLHLHLFGNDIPVEEAGAPGAGPWQVYDDLKIDIDTELPEWGEMARVMASEPEKLCARVADARTGHALVRADDGNCVPIEYTG